MKLTPTQHLALELASTTGEIKRFTGGYWASPIARLDAGRGDDRYPERHVGVATITNLERRGLLELVAGGSVFWGPYRITDQGWAELGSERAQ